MAKDLLDFLNSPLLNEVYAETFSWEIKRDWVAKVVFLMQILPILGGRSNRYF